MSELQKGHILAHRSDLMQGLEAIAFSQLRFERISKDDNYSSGYNEGFKDCLAAVKQLIIGGGNERI